MAAEIERIARTESVFRHVNERIAETTARFDADEAQFVCECADPECHHRVHATLREYEEARQDATTFLVAEGHEIPEHEQVVKRGGGHAVIRKVTGSLAAAVRRTDPRANPA